jgi:hypothetical protein
MPTQIEITQEFEKLVDQQFQYMTALMNNHNFSGNDPLLARLDLDERQKHAVDSAAQFRFANNVLHDGWNGAQMKLSDKARRELEANIPRMYEEYKKMYVHAAQGSTYEF